MGVIGDEGVRRSKGRRGDLQVPNQAWHPNQGSKMKEFQRTAQSANSRLMRELRMDWAQPFRDLHLHCPLRLFLNVILQPSHHALDDVPRSQVPTVNIKSIVVMSNMVLRRRTNGPALRLRWRRLLLLLLLLQGGRG
jgi:hypothetical protein